MILKTYWGLSIIGITLAFIGQLTTHNIILIIGTVTYCLAAIIGIGCVLYFEVIRHGN